MANYHFEISNISRGKGRSVTSCASYICGCKLHDSYNDKTYSHRRGDVMYWKVYQPFNAPAQFSDLQCLCNKIDEAEKRYDSRTGREFIGSLPNELPHPELVRIVNEYVEEHFVKKGLCAVAAIHDGRNEDDPFKNNPHVHILVTTRTVGPDGFSEKKDREHNKKMYVKIWREGWANVQNRAYERNDLEIRVSHESLEVRGIRREPTPHLTRIDWQREECGERTPAGDRKRAIQERNSILIQEHRLRRVRELTIELSR